MKRKKRDKLEISTEILRLACDGTRRTRVVYQANLSFNLMKEYLQMLTERGLIESTNGVLYTTDKGLEFLDKCEEVMAIFHSVENGKSSHTEVRIPIDKTAHADDVK